MSRWPSYAFLGVFAINRLGMEGLFGALPFAALFWTLFVPSHLRTVVLAMGISLAAQVMGVGGWWADVGALVAMALAARNFPIFLEEIPDPGFAVPAASIALGIAWTLQLFLPVETVSFVLFFAALATSWSLRSLKIVSILFAVSFAGFSFVQWHPPGHLFRFYERTSPGLLSLFFFTEDRTAELDLYHAADGHHFAATAYNFLDDDGRRLLLNGIAPVRLALEVARENGDVQVDVLGPVTLALCEMSEKGGVVLHRTERVVDLAECETRKDWSTARHLVILPPYGEADIPKNVGFRSLWICDNVFTAREEKRSPLLETMAKAPENNLYFFRTLGCEARFHGMMSPEELRKNNPVIDRMLQVKGDL